AKRAETRECPVCGDHIPLRLLGQHYTLEFSRVQTILDRVGDLNGFSDPYASPHASTLVRRRAAPHPRDASSVFAARLTKIINSIKRRRKARHLALRVVTRDEDEFSVDGKGKRRANATEQCPVCIQDVEGDPDVIEAHIDACLVHAELHRARGSADEDTTQNKVDYENEGDVDPWEESEAPDGVRRLRLRAGATTSTAALGFMVGSRAVEDVDDEIDVEGDDLGAFGAAQFTEEDVLAEDVGPESFKHDTSLHTAEPEVDLAIERARLGKDSQALITALERKVRLLMASHPFLRSQSANSAFACRICFEIYREPTVSVGCWHACCRACWLRCLNATGVCPICKRITVSSDLRRVYM
ncbi:hypothetical protein F5148DRAFT_1329979, partial [Russula earlei]